MKDRQEQGKLRRGFGDIRSLEKDYLFVLLDKICLMGCMGSLELFFLSGTVDAICVDTTWRA